MCQGKQDPVDVPEQGRAALQERAASAGLGAAGWNWTGSGEEALWEICRNWLPSTFSLMKLRSAGTDWESSQGCVNRHRSWSEDF